MRRHHRGVHSNGADIASATGTSDRNVTSGQSVLEEEQVVLYVRRELGQDIVHVRDRIDRALRFAGSAVDALVGLDVELPSALVDAVHGTDVHAAAVADVDTRLSDDERHIACCLPVSVVGSGQAPTRRGRMLGGHLVADQVVRIAAPPGLDLDQRGAVMPELVRGVPPRGCRAARRDA